MPVITTETRGTPKSPVASVPLGWRFSRWVTPLAVALAVWIVPHGGYPPKTWGLLCIFAATIAGIITQPLPSGAIVLIGITAANLSGVLTIQQTLSGFGNSTVWLIVAAFVFARGFIQTGLGERIAYIFVEKFASGPLRLGYSLVMADLVMAPVTASNTARAGGVLFPVVQSIARVFDSHPGPTAGRIGAFLMLLVFHGDVVVSAMFLTSMAGNILLAGLAAQAGVTVPWVTWMLAALVPGAAALALVPYAVFRLFPPELRETGPARHFAAARLAEIGSLTARENRMLAVFALVLSLWITGTWHQISATSVAFLGIALLLIFQVLHWREVLEEKGAWDALIWFGGLVMLAEKLNEAGLTKAFAARASLLVRGWAGVAALVLLLLIYFLAHYAFAGSTAYVTAIFPAFFAVAISCGAPPVLSALAFGFFTNISSGLTHYGTAPGVIYFGAGFVTQTQWWKLGFILCSLQCLIWLALGLPWWKLIGLW